MTVVIASHPLDSLKMHDARRGEHHALGNDIEGYFIFSKCPTLSR